MEVRTRVIMLATALISFATAAMTQVNVPANSPVVQAGASGSDVVDAVVDLIYHSCVFPEDYLFLRRVAYLETEDGKTPNTYIVNSYYSGIWRTNKNIFTDTQRPQNSPALLEAQRKIEVAFGINWQNVVWDDLQKPLYSALATMLYLTHMGNPIPSSLNDQIPFWVSNFPSTGYTPTPGWDKACSGTEQADVVFVLDSATTNDNFRQMLSYIEFVVDGLPVDSNNVRVVLYQMGASSFPRNDLSLGTTSSKSSILAAIVGTSQISGLTSSAPDIGYQLQHIVGDAFRSPVGRPNAAKIIVLVTASNPSSLTSMQTARDMAGAEGVSVFTVGVGDEALMTSLAHVTTQPECDHQIRVDQFSSLRNIVQQTQFKICREPMIALGMIRCRLDQCRNLAFRMTSPQMTIRANTTCGSGKIYVSTRSPRPTGSFRDVEDLVMGTDPYAAAVSITGTSPYIYATFIQVTPGVSNCYALIQADNGIISTPTTPTTTTYRYPSTNPCQALGRTVDRFPDPFDTRMFIQCDLLDRMYLTVCPPEAPYFDPNCRYCAGANVPSLAGCTTPVTSGFCGLFSSPCTKQNLLNHNFFFACPNDNSKYLQCDPWGNTYLESCPSQAVWQQDQLRCVASTVTGPCTGLSRYVADPYDPHRYYLCDNQNVLLLTCIPASYIFVQMLNSCQPPVTYPPFTPVTYYVQTTPVPPTQVVIGVGGLISRGFKAPCTSENIQQDKLYFPYTQDPNKYIQCDLWGDAFLKSCQPGFYFLVDSSTCV